MKYCVILFLFFAGPVLYAQDSLPLSTDSVRLTKNNMIKANLVPLTWGMGSLSYERKVIGRLTIGVTANYRPENQAPFKNTLQKIIGNENGDQEDGGTFDINHLKYANLSLAPELKLYLGKKGVFHGFYIAAFAKTEKTTLNYEYQFPELLLLGEDPNLPLKGDIKALSAGLYFGIQWHLGSHIYLDWQIIGGNFGSATVDLAAQRNISKEEQAELLHFAEDLKESFDKIDYEISDNGIKLKGKMPWVGLRTGLSISYRF
ncbi:MULTISPECIES: hypothetical protein [unclassified Myroides]|uniref:hypothetical protein n=1 Tax=unclassified Myroides TaxID=2642485 RepID=UPI003D2F5F5E